MSVSGETFRKNALRNLRVALAQLSPRLGDLEANLELHERSVRQARRERADLVVFPELSLTGYSLQDQVPEVALRTREAPFRKVAALSRSIDVLLGFVEEADGHRYYNAAAYLSRGRLLHVHRKVYLPTYGMFDEGRDFAAGDRLRSFPTRFGTVGVLICEDFWHPAASWLLAHQGAELLLAPSSGPTRGARAGRGITSIGVWHDILKVTAQVLTSFVVYVNRVGYEDGLNFGGGSVVLDPFGRVLASLPALDEGMVVAEIEGEVLRRARTAYPLLRDDDLDLIQRELARIRSLRYEIPEEAPQPEERVARSRPGGRRSTSR